MDSVPTPIGRFVIVADEGGGLHAAGFADRHPRLQRQLERWVHSVDIIPRSNPGGLGDVVGRYFAGEPTAMDRVPVVLHGTAFQCAVWQALREIPPGQAWSYGRLAKHMGRATSARAVGLANGSNPVAVAVPCHRLIGSNGALTGYGAGVDRKRWLLAHEGCSSFRP